MQSALWLLLWLRFRGWLRRLARGARTFRGALLLAVGLGFAVCMCLPSLVAYLFQYFFQTPSEAHESLRQVRFFGPVGLLTYCVLTVVFSSSEKAITFTPPEIDFLFPGPFTRRQLLLYKIAGQFLACVGSGVFMTFFLLSAGVWIVAAFPGVVLTLTFVSLFSTTIGLLANTLGARAYNLGRRTALALVLAAVVVVGFYLLRGAVDLSAPDALDQVQNLPVVRWLLTPFQWFGNMVTARTWSGLALNGVLSLGVILLLVGFVMVLDAHYLEASATASERLFALVERARRGGGFLAARADGRKPRFSLPALPWWGGVGPVAWRQLTTAVRSLRGVVFFMVIFGAGVLIPLAIAGAADGKETRIVSHVLLTTMLTMSLVMLPSMTTYDFRGDVDRMDVLKSLPIHPWALVVGQLVAPVVLLGLVQCAMVLMAQLVWGEAGPVLVPILVLVWPVDFLTIAMDNLLFLVFPARLGPQGAGDFQSVGRQMLLLLAKAVALGVAGAAAGIAALIAFLIAGGLVVFYDPPQTPPLVAVAAAVLAAWLVLVACCAAVVPLLAWGFARYDVTRDTPA